MDGPIRYSLWTSLLQADQEQRYWHAKACERVGYDLWSKIILAFLSSSAVAGWTFWADYPAGWKGLSALATLLSIVLPLVALNSQVVTMTEVHGRWLQLKHMYEAMWRDQSLISTEEIRKKLDEAKGIEAELSAKAIRLPSNDKRLGAKTYRAVTEEWVKS